MSKQWSPAALPGCYISADGKYTAELRKAGFSADFNCRMARHYVIRLRYQSTIIGTALTLSDAAREYLRG
ncbi:hypothetical protein FDI69_gp144 [Rhodococcus phage Trina]|uniref:Uncharacterized protein n=1 Tax=Rhodococcus phage Trina TaxID=2027905 RepID=A0A2D0ZN77_9CAUD|nr:hypothetical protein FDI69_gp144 [Rhodococcus phage Trina]ASZ75041.1 hypothetical protein SEA_TRINA_263 [Rhodococcus phage Trina]